MPQISGPGNQIYSLVGEGLVLVTPKGGNPDDDATDYHPLSWEATLEVEKQMVTNTSDFNPTTNRMNPRSLIVSERLSGTLHFHHNLDPALDVLKNVPLGSYPIIRLFISQGRLAVTGPPAVTGINRAYFDLTEANIGPISLGGGDVNTPRPVDITFESNGTFQYASEAAVAP